MSPAVQQELERLLSEPVSSVIEREQNALEELLETCGRKIVLFGAGSLGRRSLACLRSIGVEPLAFSDNHQGLWGTQVDGLTVLPPAIAAERFGAEALFLVTIWTAQHRFVNTSRQLEGLGARTVLPGAALYWRFPETFFPYFAQDIPHKVYQDAESVREAATLWADQRSGCDYLAQIRWRALGDYAHLPAPEPETYFPDDLIRLSPDEVLVDCGAYDGDTVRAFIAQCGGRFRSIHALEADAISFARLQSYISTLAPAARGRIELLRCAVASERGIVRFEETGGVNSKASADGSSTVDAVPLQELFETARVTYIKMDIEGAEFDALTGARKLIERDRPVLAICVYHRQDDLWRIPLLIRQMAPEYKMHLRMYECEGWQTVLYALPPERA
jgi:FkbM family methyltransferase